MIFTAFRTLLRFYPPDYQQEFAPEMTSVFVQAARQARLRGRPAYGAFLLRELSGLLIGAIRERASVTSLVPMLGGLAAALLLNFAFYTATARVLRAVSIAFSHPAARAANPDAVALSVFVIGGSLVPLFLGLALRITWRYR